VVAIYTATYPGTKQSIQVVGIVTSWIGICYLQRFRSIGVERLKLPIKTFKGR